MTNEEIEKAVLELDAVVCNCMAGPPRVVCDDHLRLCASARSLVSRAYEKAAQIADSYETASNGNHARDVADEVRALKDSLQPVESAST